MHTTAQKIAHHLLQVSAVKLNTDKHFTWASGWYSPIYCDNRLTLSFVEVRNEIRNELANLIKTHYPDAEVIAGVATAGIPQAALVADQLGLPLVYVRSAAKGHGMQNLIEGRVETGQKVVVIEDLISTGGSSLKAAQALQEAGANVQAMVAVFTYGFEVANQNFAQANIPLHTLSDYNTLINVALAEQYISTNDVASLQEWRKAPEIWKK